jgi:hypothetical protein
MHSTAFEANALKQIPALLQGWLGEPVEVLPPPAGADLLVTSERAAFLIDVTTSDHVASLERARAQLARAQLRARKAVPVVATPYMGPRAREYARDGGLSWMDLSGNADIHGSGVRIMVTGQPNRFSSRGRPASVFSPKAARLTRTMLVEPDRWWRRSELSETTELSAGFVSKIVRRMLDDQLLDQRAEDQLVRPHSPSLLLDAWAQQHHLARPHVERFHSIGRTGPTVVRSLAGKLDGEAGLRWAATGLAAAWLWTQFADFRLTTLYVSRPLDAPERLDLRPVEKGANVWLLMPRDEGVFHSSERVEGVACVHPVQVYVDLLSQPERAKDAAANLRSVLLKWRA